MTTPRPYTPRRANVRRWLQDAPDDVLDCFDAGPKDYDRFTIFLGKRFLLDDHVSYLYCSTEPRDFSGSGQLKRHQAAAYRHRSGRQRTRWNDLPENVRAFVVRWINEQ